MPRKKRKVRAGTPTGYRAGLWEQRIRSRGKGRGLGYGKGRGPIGVPFGIKLGKTRRPLSPMPPPRPPMAREEAPFLELERTTSRRARKIRRGRT